MLVVNRRKCIFVEFYISLIYVWSFIQICDGRRDSDIRNRRRDAEDDDNQEFTVRSL